MSDLELGYLNGILGIKETKLEFFAEDNERNIKVITQTLTLLLGFCGRLSPSWEGIKTADLVMI